jgi:hypothetical protein
LYFDLIKDEIARRFPNIRKFDFAKSDRTNVHRSYRPHEWALGSELLNEYVTPCLNQLEALINKHKEYSCEIRMTYTDKGIIHTILMSPLDV